MIRPDQIRFNTFSQHLREIDEILQQYADRSGMLLKKNLHRQPNRVLQREDDLNRMIGIHLDGHWLKMDYTDDLPHFVGVAAVYRNPIGRPLIKQVLLARHTPFSIIKLNIHLYLDQAIQIVQSWNPPDLGNGGKSAHIDEGWQTESEDFGF